MLKAGLLLTVAALAAALFVGCGGSDSPSAAPDPDKIPTATLPAVLPEPFFIDGTPSSPGPSGNTYIVQSGDSMYLIAERLGISLEELMELNESVDPTALEIGQVLQLPASQGSTPTPQETPEASTPTPGAATPTEEAAAPTVGPTAPPPTPGEGETTYTVQPGDNANDIALQFGITVEELALANNTTVDDLRSLDVGDVLIIPVSSTPPPTEETEPPPETPTPGT
jgi:LysM repeat protein